MINKIDFVSVKRKELLALGGAIASQLADSMSFDKDLLREYRSLRKKLDEAGICVFDEHINISEKVGSAVDLGLIDPAILEDILKNFPRSSYYMSCSEAKLESIDSSLVYIRSRSLNIASAADLMDASRSFITLCNMTKNADLTAIVMNSILGHSESLGLRGKELTAVIASSVHTLLAHHDITRSEKIVADEAVARLIKRTHSKENPATISLYILDSLLDSEFEMSAFSAFKYLNFDPEDSDSYVKLYDKHGVHYSDVENCLRLDWSFNKMMIVAAGIMKLKTKMGDANGYYDIFRRFDGKLGSDALLSFIVSTCFYPMDNGDALRGYASAMFDSVIPLPERARLQILKTIDSSQNGKAFMAFARSSKKFSRLVLEHDFDL